jgi:hypothetical protein
MVLFSESFTRLTRWRAAGLHLLVSAGLVSVVLLLVGLVWYPFPFFWISGVWFVLTLMVLVDVCLGPLLTAVVFKPGKKGLKMDLMIIFTVQILALLYATHTLYKGRIAFLVFDGRIFNVMSAKDVSFEKIEDFPNAKIKKLPSGRYEIVAIKNEYQNLKSVSDSESVSSLAPQFFPQYYTNLGEVKDRLLEGAKTKDELISMMPDQKSIILKAVDNSVDSLLFLASSDLGVVLVMVDRNSLQIVDTLLLKQAE